MRAIYLRIGLLLGLAATATAKAGPGTAYFFYLFALDDGRQTPARNHTWASCVHAAGTKTFETSTVNWLPASHAIDALAIGPKRGRNFPADDAFQWARRDGLTLAQWGPYAVSEDLYTLCLKQKTRLESGEVWYRPWDDAERIFKLLDPPSVPAPRALSGIHAVSDIVYPVDPRGFLQTGVTDGIEATAKVAWHLEGWYLRDPGAPSGLAAVDAALKADMDQAIGLSSAPTPSIQALEPRNNHYCRTVKECLESGNNLLPN